MAIGDVYVRIMNMNMFYVISSFYMVFANSIFGGIILLAYNINNIFHLIYN